MKILLDILILLLAFIGSIVLIAVLQEVTEKEIEEV